MSEIDKRAPGYERRHVNAASSATGDDVWNECARGNEGRENEEMELNDQGNYMQTWC